MFNKYTHLFVFAILAAMSLNALASIRTPADRYEWIGSFKSSNPFDYDTDGVIARFRAPAQGLAFQLDGGPAVDIRQIEVYCRPLNGTQFLRDSLNATDHPCFYSRGGVVDYRRPFYMRFRHDVIVEHIRVTSKPMGYPGSKVNVFIERGWRN